MECADFASPDIERSDEYETILKELSPNSTQPTVPESEDKSKDPYMERPEPSPEDEQTITTFTTDSSYIVTCRISSALAILKGMVVALFQCTVFHIYMQSDVAFEIFFLTPAKEINSHCFAKTVLYIFFSIILYFLKSSRARGASHWEKEKRDKERCIQWGRGGSQSRGILLHWVQHAAWWPCTNQSGSSDVRLGG